MNCLLNWCGLGLGWGGMWACIGDVTGYSAAFFRIVIFVHWAILFLVCLRRFDPPNTPTIDDDEYPRNVLPIEDAICKPNMTITEFCRSVSPLVAAARRRK